MSIKGVSGKYTPQKLAIFSKFVEHHINIVNLIYGKYGQKDDYLYFDVFAGPGWIPSKKYGYEEWGSPIRFNRIMSLQNISYRMICAEKDKARYTELEKWLELENAPFSLVNNALKCCPKYIVNSFGIVYIDPPMTKDTFLLSKEIVSNFAQYCPKIDILMYISAGSIKRLLGADHVKFDTRLRDFMIPEKDWVIRESFGEEGQQYTFLVGTKITKTLTWAKWSNEKFYDVNSHDGQRILFRLNNNELKQKFNTYGARQMEMF